MRIEDRIRSLVRADLDDITQPGLPDNLLPAEIAFFRITELARFWDEPQAGSESLAQRQQRLITSLYGIRSPWAYVIHGERGVASVYLGVPCRSGQARSWEQRLTAQLPGSSWRMDQSSPQMLTTLVSFPLVASISGNPSIPPANDHRPDRERHSPGLESLFETMAGVRWAYMVLARPLTEQEVTEDLQRTESDMLEINSAYRRRSSAEESNNPLVTRYVALLESAHQKLLQGQRHGMWDVQSYLMTDNVADCERGAQAVHAAFGGPASEPQPIRIITGSRTSAREVGTRLTTRLSTSEVAALASLPKREVAGLQVTEYVAFGMVSGVSAPGDIALGTIMSGGNSTPIWFEFLRDSLARHVFVAGVTGSGKTRTCMYLLYQLWREHQIPWLVLEPSMKNEYRELLHSSIGTDLRVFTAGDESVSPLRLNPLEVPQGIHVQTHIGSLATLFRAAFAMEAPLPYVLDDAIHHVYEDRGWDLVSGTHPDGGLESQPTLGDLLVTCEKVVHQLGYDRELTSNLHAALRTRLTSLMRGAKGRMLNVRQSISMEDLLSAPTTIEFSCIGDDEEKAFLMGCILLKLVQHRQAQGRTRTGLRHVTLVDEAHRLLRNVPETVGTSVANSKRQAVESFSNMLAEIRAYGEGLIVADQMPSKLVPDVIRNSGMKIVHRLTAEEERRIVGGAMSLNEPQMRFLSSLPVGQAIVYSEGSANACRVCIPDHAGRGGYLREHPSHSEVREHMQKHHGTSGLRDAQNGAEAADVPAGVIPGRCESTCTPYQCAIQIAAEAYASRHGQQLEAQFQAAMARGFDALWTFAVHTASAIWPESGHPDNGPLCAIMTIASRQGLDEKDLRILRRNMMRLRDNQRQGGPL